MPSSLPNDQSSEPRQQGIAALKAGDSARARDLLAQAIQLNPRDELAWLWLSGAVDTDRDRRRCLERVLALNPHNAAALRGLANLASAPVDLPPIAPGAGPATSPAEPAREALHQAALASDDRPAAPSIPAAPQQPPEPNLHRDTLASPVAPEHGAATAATSLDSLRPARSRWRIDPLVAGIAALICVIVAFGAILGIRALNSPPAGAEQPTAPSGTSATAVPTPKATPRPVRPSPAPTTTPVAPAATAAPQATSAPAPTAQPASLPLSTLVQRGLRRERNGDPQGALADYTAALAADQNDADAYYYRGDLRTNQGDKMVARRIINMPYS